MPRERPLGVVIALLAMAGCSAPAAQRRELPEVRLPAPPATARVRLTAVLPDPNAPRPSTPWWRVFLHVLTGDESGPAAEPEALVRPFGVALGPRGDVVVADPDAGRVVRFSPGALPAELRCAGLSWDGPIALASGADGTVYVADASAGIVVRWSPTACTAFGRGELERPTAVAVAGDRVWIADPPRHRLVAFTPAGAVVARIGERGDGVGQFHYPSALATTRGGGVAVVDALNFRIVLLDGAGTWLSAFGAPGTTGGGLARPKGVAIDEAGRIWVTDAQRDAILVFEPDGAFSYAFGETGDAPGQLAHPAGIVAANGRVVVADSQNHRVQVFETIGAPQ